MIFNFKKINTTDLEQLLDGTINEVVLGNYITLVKHNDNALMLYVIRDTYTIKIQPKYLDSMIEDIYRCIFNQLGYAFVDCGEYYEDLTIYLNRCYSMGEIEFTPIRMANGDMLYPTEDLNGFSDIFEVGFYTGDNRFFVRVGDVANTFEGIFNNTDIVNDMVNRYRDYLWDNN